MSPFTNLCYIGTEKWCSSTTDDAAMQYSETCDDTNSNRDTTGEVVSTDTSNCITNSDWSGDSKSVGTCTFSNGTITTTTFENGKETVVSTDADTSAGTVPAGTLAGTFARRR
jgi:hypothetical protein